MADEREEELDTIAAIFPELVVDSENACSASLDLPVTPAKPISVSFPSAIQPAITALGAEIPPEETHILSHLPPIRLRITLPEGYPAESPPVFAIVTNPQWLSGEIITRLQADGTRMWEEFGHDQVVYAYIDHLQQAAENAFGIVDSGEGNREGETRLQMSPEHKIAILDYDMKAKKDAFEKETFECGICLDPKKGSACHRMLDCGHVFCRQCLQDFYNNAINEGDLASVRCLAPNCAKKRGETVTEGRRRKPKTAINPSELLQIPLEQETVRRYVMLKHKAELESDKDTIYCPRKWCQGAARSRKHRKPGALEDMQSSDEESETEDDSKKGFQRSELLAVCEDCSFAFCSRCLQGWHGESNYCVIRRVVDELSEDEKASLEYLKLHTTPCPTCVAPAQKTHGCNHMICFRCNSHFCYLCSSWLEPSNPYKHFNDERTGCYMRLWELEGGDGDDVGIGFAGGRAPLQEQRENLANLDEVVELLEPLPEPEAAPLVPLAAPFAREGPLVLRIGQLPPRPEPAAPVPLAEHVPGGRRGGRGGRGAFRGRGGAAAARQAGRAAENAEEIQRRAEENQRAWVQRFVQAAMNDEEEFIDEGDEDDDQDWEIPVR